MTGEQIAFRRVALGVPIAEYARLMDRARVNLGGKGSGISTVPSASLSSEGVVVTAHATAHTKGTPVELFASTPFDAETIEIYAHVTTAGTTNTSTMIDIVTGASLTTVLIPELIVGFVAFPARFAFPVRIPAGTRVGVQAQGAVTLQSARVGMRLHQAGTHSAPGTTVTALGTSSATSNGVTLTINGVANTKPTAFDEIISATAANYRFLVASVSLPPLTIITNSDGLVDIATGAASSETVIIGDIPYSTNTLEYMVYSGSTFYSAPIPAGTRLSARMASSTTASSGRCSVALYGVN